MALCSLFGHIVDNGTAGTCPCGAGNLNRAGAHTHIRHTLSCFFLGHRYQLAGARNGHNEYGCVNCGHPLLMPVWHDQSPRTGVFRKAVHYYCGLFGHEVHKVCDRDGFAEYACYCGHTFLRPEEKLTRLRHPWVCICTGHRIRFLCERFGHSEFVCRDCGHPFCFRLSES